MQILSTGSRRVGVLIAAAAMSPLGVTFALLGIGHGVVPLAAPSAQAQQRGFVSPQAAFEQGLSAYKSGVYEIAVPALEHAAAKGDGSVRFFAEFYLARIFGDTTSLQYDQAKAYIFYHRIAEENADMDPDDLKRAPFVASALTALAGLVRQGVPEAGLRPDIDRALEYYQHAATIFGDKDAQYEIARIYVQPDQPDENVKRGAHFLLVLSQDGHAGAQATLAEIYWKGRGRVIPKDERRALGLITVAVQNASPADRLWVEDLYQNIYCASSQGSRKDVNPLIASWKAEWKRILQRKGEDDGRMALGKREPSITRACGNGEPVDLRRGAVTSGTTEYSASGGGVSTSAQGYLPQQSVPVRDVQPR